MTVTATATATMVGRLYTAMVGVRDAIQGVVCAAGVQHDATRTAGAAHAARRPLISLFTSLY